MTLAHSHSSVYIILRVFFFFISTFHCRIYLMFISYFFSLLLFIFPFVSFSFQFCFYAFPLLVCINTVLLEKNATSFRLTYTYTRVVVAQTNCFVWWLLCSSPFPSFYPWVFEFSICLLFCFLLCFWYFAFFHWVFVCVVCFEKKKSRFSHDGRLGILLLTPKKW